MNLLVKEREPDRMVCKTSLIEFLKKDDRYSQRKISERMKQPRSYMRKVERVDWREIPLGEFLELAAVFEVDPRKIVSSLQYAMHGHSHPPFRRSVDHPEQGHLLNEGIQCMPLIETQGQITLAVFYLEPHASCDFLCITPRGEQAWLLALQGAATVEMGPQSYVLKEREFLHPPKSIPYQLYNPSPSTKLCLLAGIQKT